MPPETQPQMPPHQPLQPAQPSVRPKKFSKLLKILLAVGAGVIIFFVGIFFFVIVATKDAVKVSDRLVADIQANKIDDAYSLTTADFQKSISKDEFRQTFDQTSPLLQGKVKLTNRVIRTTADYGKLTIVLYRIDTAAGTRYIRVVLQKHGTWQVFNYSSSSKAFDTLSY